MVYERDLDLNLLRVFAVVAETGSVTQAATQLYLTQPAVSAALRRLSDATGTPLFTRSGRGIALTSRGAEVRSVVRTHLIALTGAVRATEAFDPKTVERRVRLGLGDAVTPWLLPKLIQLAAEHAPGLSFITLPVQFRNVARALSAGDVDIAVAVADDLPSDVVRERLFTSDFVALYDPAVLKLPRVLSRERYLQEWHIIVSYNGDTRGLVEDVYGVRRKVRASIASFDPVGALVEGSALIATIPRFVATDIQRVRPKLRLTKLPFPLEGAYTELLHRRATDDDPMLGWVREHVRRFSRER